ncbi:hypothetical protein E9531_00420 [Lampropedia puyangensis]|uniref:Big-1 domain-containing protein n=1 Tax=Lampropedia puyangensis TaxID=1330072 RepID=A0A4S8FCG1_9BURK|nr:hypothetical protein [Lampropedia puyangensis]THU05057.1 hypothetical protein E9531_00420 [Lampropedia puyangensis]
MKVPLMHVHALPYFFVLIHRFGLRAVGVFCVCLGFLGVTNIQAQGLSAGISSQSGVSLSTSDDGDVLTITVDPVAQALIRWDTFDIGNSSEVHVVFSQADTVLRNEVTGTTGGLIAGTLTSVGGGTVHIEHAAGVQFGSSARLTLTGGDFSVSSQGDIVLGGNWDGRNLTVQAGGSLTQSGAISVNGTSSFTATSDIALDQSGNVFEDVVSLNGNASQVTASGGLRFGILNVISLMASADTLYLPRSLTTLGGQSYRGRLVLEGDTSLTSTLGALAFTSTLEGPHALSLHASGTVYLDAMANIASLDATATETQLVSDITTLGDIALTNTRVIGDVALTSTGGSVQINGSLNGLQDDTDVLSITADGQIALQNAVGNDVRLHDLSLSAGTVSTFVVDVGNRLAIDSIASITQNGAYNVGGTSRFASDGSITLLNIGNIFGGDVELNGSNVQIAAQGPLTLSGVDANLLHATATDLLTVRNADVATSSTLTGDAVALDGVALGQTAEVTALDGNITQQGSVRVDGPSRWTAAGDVLLDNDSNQLNGPVTAVGGAITLATAGALDVANVQASGQATLRGNGVYLGSAQATGLQVDSSAGITQGSALNLASGSRFTAVDDVLLDNAGNTFGGGIQVMGRNIDIHSAGGLLLNGVEATGNLRAAAAGGSLLQSGDVRVQGRSDLLAGGSVQLDRAGNQFGGPVVVEGRSILLRAGSGLDMESVRNGSNSAVQLLATGDIDVAGDAIDTGNSLLSLLSSAGQVRTATTLRGSQVSIGGVEGIRIGGEITASRLSLTATRGDVLQQSGRIQSGDALLSAGQGDLRLTSADNRFNGVTTLYGRDVDMAAGGLLLGDVAVSRNLKLDSSGSITQQAQMRVTGDAELRAAGDITLLHAGNRFGSSLSLSGVNMQLHSDENVTLLRADGQHLSLNGDGVFLIPDGTTISTGSVDLRGGNLQVRGALTNALTVESGATISGDGTVGTLVVKPQAQVQPGVDASSAAVLTVRSFQAEPGAMLRIHVQDAGVASRLQVNGLAQLNGHVQLVSLGTMPSGRFHILDSTQPIQGAFADMVFVPALAAETISQFSHEEQAVVAWVVATPALETEGTDQTAVIHKAFADPLLVRLLDDDGAPVEGISVEFSTPATGAGAVLSQTLVLTNANGEASVTATANAEAGQYLVTARVQGLAESVNFALENTLHEVAFTLTTTPAQPLEGEEFTIEVQMQSDADTAPTGTLNVLVAGQVVCPDVALAQSTAQCVLPKGVSLAKSTHAQDGAKAATVVVAGQTLDIEVQYSGDALHQSATWTTQLALMRQIVSTPVPWNAPWALLCMGLMLALSARLVWRRRAG